MGHMNLRYYEQVKDYLHPHLHGFINGYRAGDIISLPLHHGCNRVDKNGTRKEIAYNLGYQCVVPTYNYKLKKYEHMSKTPMRGDFKYLQSIRKDLFKHALR